MHYQSVLSDTVLLYVNKSLTENGAVSIITQRITTMPSYKTTT